MVFILDRRGIGIQRQGVNGWARTSGDAAAWLKWRPQSLISVWLIFRSADSPPRAFQTIPPQHASLKKLASALKDASRTTSSKKESSSIHCSTRRLNNWQESPRAVSSFKTRGLG